MNSYAKFGGAARRHFSAICEKPMGAHVPPGRARVKGTFDEVPHHLTLTLKVKVKSGHSLSPDYVRTNLSPLRRIFVNGKKIAESLFPLLKDSCPILKLPL